MARLIIYVSGPINRHSEHTVKRSVNDLSIVCRKIILTGHIPVCPIVAIEDYIADPRLSHDLDWWVSHYCTLFMQMADNFCFIPNMAGTVSKMLEKEKNAWRALNKGRMISSDIIMKVLIDHNMENMNGH